LFKEKAYDPARSKVADLAEDVREKAENIAEDLRLKANDVARDLKERANEIWEKSKKAVAEKQNDIFDSLPKNHERKRLS